MNDLPSICACCLPVSVTTKRRTLQVSIALALSFALLEWITSRLSHSLSLLADSGHMAIDGLALALALWATWKLRRPTQSPGKREIWAALVNGLSLFVMAALIAVEALHHWHAPPTEILSLPMLGVAILGLMVNGISAALLHRDSQRDLNLRGAFLHIVADLLGSVGAIAAAIAIYCFDWHWVDTAVGFGISALIAVSAFPVVHQSWQALRSGSVSSEAATPLEASGWMELGTTDLAQQIRAKSEVPINFPSKESPT
ncbi:cation diffusion facilitator family transporter [Baaleninema sp.]|uniref:cation diffusion facilitator family transporter n=1 Tax=Baaleninema sp. TaxID=3101197 RepID=UPI003CFEF0C4